MRVAKCAKVMSPLRGAVQRALAEGFTTDVK